MKATYQWLWLLIPIFSSPFAVGQERGDVLAALNNSAAQAVPAHAGDSTASPHFDSADTVGAETFWARAEYTFGWIRGSHLPPLVTTSPVGTAQAQAGVLGSPGATILEGDAYINGDLRSGARATLGCWLAEDQSWGLEGTFFMFGSQNHHFAASSDGSQILSRPFTNALNGNGSSQLVSYPGVLAGTVTVDAAAAPLYSANLLLRRSLWKACSCDTFVLGGYRYLGYGEDLQIGENLTSLAAPTLGTNFLIRDHFATRNEFHGGEFALGSDFVYGRLSLGYLAALSVGNLRRTVIIDGRTQVTVPGFAPVNYAGGLLALSSNSGRYVSDAIVVMPEFGITAGWQLTSRLRTTVGYNVLWLPSVASPGDQIDAAVNPNLLPPVVPGGPARPAFALRESSIWVQSLNVGLELKF